MADVSSFDLPEKYDLWHDRAAFHFLTRGEQIINYMKTLQNSIAKGGIIILGTFSENGPLKCSGMSIKQYSIQDMEKLFPSDYLKLGCENLDHITPTGAVQNFTFCRFQNNI